MLLDHTNEVLCELRKRTDRVILFYSGGKDSITLLHLIRQHQFKEVVCVYMAFIKGLSHNRHLLDWVKPQTLLEVQHWATTEYLSKNYMRMQTKTEVKQLKQADIENYVRAKTGIDWIITGMKQCDSINRRVMLRQFESDAIDNKGKRVHPLSRWTNKQVWSFLRISKLPMPIQYEPGKSSQGIDLDAGVLKWFKDHHKADYDKIISVFPLAESNLMYEHDKVSSIHASNNSARKNKKRPVQSPKD